MTNDISSLAKAFADVTYDNSTKEPEDLFYGVISSISDRIYVRVDGSDAIIPVQSSVLVGVGDRVMVRTKDHQAVIEANDTYKSGSVKYELDQTIIDRLNMLQAGVISAAIINASEFTNGSISGSAIDTSTFTDGTISGSKITNSTITSTQIADSTITNAKIANSTITGSKIVDGTLDGSTKIADATISYAKIDSSFVGSLVADSAFVTELQAEIATFGYITAQQADLDYAQIDFANVANGAIKTALIQDGAITDAKIGGVSANKLTAGTIDASNITVTNLNATNITTGRITVDGITIDVTNNEARIDGGYIEDGTITMNGFSSDVVARIDGAIETFTCTDIPTLQNYPASTWTPSDYDKHVGDVAYVVNPSSSADGYTYRFTKSSDNQFSWVLIKDTDITKALQDILDLQGDIDGIERFDSTVSSFMENTDIKISSIKNRTSSLETTMGTKVDTSTFNELSQTVDENSSTIATLTTTTDDLGTRMKQAESDITQNATNIITKVSKTDFTGQNVMSMINQDASSVTISASKVNLNGAVTFSSFSSALQDKVTGISNTATSAQTTANTANATANSAYAHTNMEDTRYDNQPPSWYMAKGKGSYIEFKLCPAIRIWIDDTYCCLTTHVPWGDSSGGRPVQEASLAESDAVWRRYATSDSEWSAWKSTSLILAHWQYSDTTYIDGGTIHTGTITANQITVGELSDLADDMGTITAGVLKSHNYVADTSGMKLTLSDGVWDSKDFKISSTGAITSTAGTIGGWTINGGTNRGISCSYTHTPGGSTDTYVDTTTLSGTIPYISMTSSRNDTVYNYTSIQPGELYSYHPGTHDVLILQYGDHSKYGLEARTGQSYIEGEVELTAGMTGEFKYLWRTTASDSNYFKITPSSGGNIDTNLDYVSTGDITGDDITGTNITLTSEVKTPFLTVTNTGNSAIRCSGGAIFGGSILVGTKKVVVDNYASGFMAFTNDTASANTVKSSTSVRYNLASVTLTPGVYIIECVAEWRSNSTSGYRDICLSTSSNGGKIDKYCESTVAPSSAYDRQTFTYTTHITSNTTFYLTAQQNSGGDITTLGGIRALRIGNN